MRLHFNRVLRHLHKFSSLEGASYKAFKILEPGTRLLRKWQGILYPAFSQRLIVGLKSMGTMQNVTVLPKTAVPAGTVLIATLHVRPFDVPLSVLTTRSGSVNW